MGLHAEAAENRKISINSDLLRFKHIFNPYYPQKSAINLTPKSTFVRITSKRFNLAFKDEMKACEEEGIETYLIPLSRLSVVSLPVPIVESPTETPPETPVMVNSNEIFSRVIGDIYHLMAKVSNGL